MSKKNPLEGLIEKRKAGSSAGSSNFPMMGAGRSIMGSIDELTKQASLATSGDTIVEIPTADVDPSFIQDRLDDGVDFEDFVRSIELEKQQQPALVRPHPKDPGRYMLVFGRRRWQAAKLLNRKLRAVIKDISDTEHVVLQGRENSARANLSYLERAVYAQHLSDLGYDTPTLLAALSCDKSNLSKLMSVASIPSDIIASFGAGHGLGRDRFYELKKLLDRPGNEEAARAELMELSDLEPSEKLAKLLRVLKSRKKSRKPASKATTPKWTSTDNAISAETAKSKHSYSIAISGASSADVTGFGDFLSEQLPTLYEQFLAHPSKRREND